MTPFLLLKLGAGALLCIALGIGIGLLIDRRKIRELKAQLTPGVAGKLLSAHRWRERDEREHDGNHVLPFGGELRLTARPALRTGSQRDGAA